MGKIKAHQVLPKEWGEREKLRDKGQFWTPSWVAEAMIAYVSREANLVFDPAVGRGAFYGALLSLGKSSVSFYGTDVDVEVLQDKIFRQELCFVEVRDFIQNPPERKFSAIVANPPYIRHHRLSRETKLLLKQLSTKITGSPIDGRAGYHIYFLIQALNILEENGRLAFIMPADTCEGKFAKPLWRWVSENFRLEAIIAFDEHATPFPGVDTNALVFLIKKDLPTKSLYWLKAMKPGTRDLLDFVLSDFSQDNLTNIKITQRLLDEAISTGLSRPAQMETEGKCKLTDFARVMRGIASGANEFFFLTELQIEALNLPKQYFRRAIGRTRDIDTDVLTEDDVNKLEKSGRPTYLLALEKDENLPIEVENYLRHGKAQGLADRALIKQRKPWYKMEKRVVPPILFTYLGRRSTRFILNKAGVLPLTGFLCLYPIYDDEVYIRNLWLALNHPDTLANLSLVGKSYGSGAIKVEPGNLSCLTIPDHIVEQFELKRRYKTTDGQMEIFREPELARTTLPQS